MGNFEAHSLVYNSECIQIAGGCDLQMNVSLLEHNVFQSYIFFRPVTVWICSKGLLQARVHESVRECYLGKSEYTRFFSPFCSVFAYYYNFSALPFLKGSFIIIFETAVVFIVLFLGNLSMFFCVQDVKDFFKERIVNTFAQKCTFDCVFHVTF